MIYLCVGDDEGTCYSAEGCGTLVRTAMMAGDFPTDSDPLSDYREERNDQMSFIDCMIID